MRPAVVVFFLVTAGALSLAFAEPPVAPAAGSRATPMQNSPAEDRTRESSASQTASATGATTTAGAASGAAANAAQRAADEQAEQKMLRLQGYKPQMISGEMVYCRREIPLGSHLPTTLKCITPAQAKLMAEEGQRTTERIQRGAPGCIATSTRRGPNTGPANCGGN